MQTLTELDKLFLRFESDNVKMHVSTLSIFERFDGHETLAKELAAALKNGAVAIPHYNEKLQRSGLTNLNWCWVPDTSPDLSYHIQRIKLPENATRHTLNEYVCKFHQQALDYHRPLWQIHLVHGFADNEVALLVKLHHCCIDGVSGFRIFERVFTSDPDLKNYRVKPAPQNQYNKNKIKKISRKFQLRRLLKFETGLFLLLRQVISGDSAMLPLKNTPHTRFNNKATSKRSFTSADFSLERIELP